MHGRDDREGEKNIDLSFKLDYRNPFRAECREDTKEPTTKRKDFRFLTNS